MVVIEDLLEGDLAAGSDAACKLLPDVVAALDHLVPRLTTRADRTTVRRYFVFTDAAARTLTGLPARCPDVLPAAAVMYGLLRRSCVEVPWVAPSCDGRGAVTVLVDRLRGFAGGLPQQCVQARRDINEHRFAGLAYGPEDLDPATAPVLVEVTLPAGQAADAYSSDGLASLGLPHTYPHNADGSPIPHSACQPIGKAVRDAGLDGVDYRSATAGGDRELAWFPRSAAAQRRSRHTFDDWW